MPKRSRSSSCWCCSSSSSSQRRPSMMLRASRLGLSLVVFLVVLNSCYHHHCFDLSDDRCGSMVLGQHGLDRVIEHLGDEDVLLRSGEDVLVAHLHLKDFFLDTP